jgi:uncharacterized protein YceK
MSAPLRKVAIVLVAAALFSGCATFQSKTIDGFGYPFAGMRDTPDNLQCSISGPWVVVMLPIVAIDLPVSFVADVLFLPFDLAAYKPGPKDRREQCSTKWWRPPSS